MNTCGDTQAQVRIGTMNVSTISGNIQRVLHKAQGAGLDILALQETRFTEGNLPGALATANSAGWEVTRGVQAHGVDGRAQGGVAILHRWPCTPYRLATQVPGRAVAVKVHRPGGGPFLLRGGTDVSP